MVDGTIFSFVAKTNDGQVFDERDMLDDGVSPWQRLRKHCEENGASIRKLSAIFPTGRRISSEGAAGYALVYRMTMLVTTGQQSLARGFGVLRDDGDEFSVIWADDEGGMNTELVPAAELAVHAAPGTGAVTYGTK